MFKKLRTVIYHVKDLAAAKAWYKNITGVDPYFDEPFYVGFDIGGFELGLDPVFTDVKKGNQSVAYWTVVDIRSTLKKIEEQGASVIQRLREVGGGIWVVVLEDPFGNAFGLIEET